jgi:uroporphyrinogen III methyltransferase/synthase
LLAADAVVCDRLATPALPCDLPADVEIRFVGKEAGYHPVPQKEINALLVRLAKEGKRVVRLKGGDPYVFGRGGEEATVLEEAGIPFEVIPCVTAAVAVPAYAGIPVTFRREVVRVTMVTAHEAVKSGGPQVRWDLIAGDPHAMILGYMGVTSLPNVLKQLMEAGMEPRTPAALIERGTTSAQRTVLSTVANLQEDVKKAGLGPPALFVIGPTIKHADVLDWFTKRPLFGKRIVVFSALREIIEELQLGGAEIVEIPERITPAARMVMGVLPLHGCIFENEEQVEALEDERDGLKWAEKSVAWCLNERAEKRARALNWPQVCRIPNLDNAAQIVSVINSLCDESKE